MAYATSADVSAELGGISITGATTITSTMVGDWIADAEDEVELLSGQVYSTTTIASTVWEYHDYDGSGVIRLDRWPVQSIELIQFNKNPLGSTTDDWTTLVGPGAVSSTNFQLYGSIGALRLHPNTTSNNPVAGNQNIRVAYTYGHTSVPRNVKELVTKLAAKRYIQAVASSTAGTGGGAISVGAISISDPNNYVQSHLARIDMDIDRLQRQVVGKFRAINYDLRLYE